MQHQKRLAFLKNDIQTFEKVQFFGRQNYKKVHFFPKIQNLEKVELFQRQNFSKNK